MAIFLSYTFCYLFTYVFRVSLSSRLKPDLVKGSSSFCRAAQVGDRPTAAAAAPAAAGSAQSNFPPAMRAYVERAFLSAKTTEQKKLLQPALKQVQCPRHSFWAFDEHGRLALLSNFRGAKALSYMYDMSRHNCS